jgi:hydrogenase maturation protease
MTTGDHENRGKEPPRFMVVGCGNPFAGDDGVGLEIVHRLTGGGYGCEFRELPEGGIDLLDLFDRADIILFVDAVLSGAPPGTLHLVPLPSRQVVPRALGKVSCHGWGLEETLSLPLAVGWRVPRMMLLGIELENAAQGASRTPPVNAALERVIEHFHELRAALEMSKSPLWSDQHTYPPGEGQLSSVTTFREGAHAVHM